MEERANRDRELRPGQRRHPGEVLRRPDPRQDHLQEGRVREGRRQPANLLLPTSGSIPCVFIL